jgi:anti-sigma regulatory factor (Ser/Thr protein kinase)
MRWVRVEDASAVPACRKAVQIMAERLRFPASRIGQLAIAVTEAASNLHKHAEQGSLLLCVNRDGPSPGIDMVTIDAGPGVRDVSVAVRDGHSTAGSLGVGLGAIQRLADSADLYSLPGRGTSLVARFLPAGGTTPPYPPAPGGMPSPQTPLAPGTPLATCYRAAQSGHSCAIDLPLRSRRWRGTASEVTPATPADGLRVLRRHEANIT